MEPCKILGLRFSTGNLQSLELQGPQFGKENTMAINNLPLKFSLSENQLLPIRNLFPYYLVAITGGAIPHFQTHRFSNERQNRTKKRQKGLCAQDNQHRSVDDLLVVQNPASRACPFQSFLAKKQTTKLCGKSFYHQSNGKQKNKKLLSNGFRMLTLSFNGKHVFFTGPVVLRLFKVGLLGGDLPWVHRHPGVWPSVDHNTKKPRSIPELCAT